MPTLFFSLCLCVLISARPAEGNSQALLPIFLHGPERANTTFWWNTFREQPRVLAFNEPFSPELRRGASEVVAWNSRTQRHGYLDRDPRAEYRELGIYPDFDDLVTYENFIWERSTDMPKVKAYIERLIQVAQARGKIPVFKLNRAFLRMAWFKENFGGTHIYLHRDLGALVNSYYSFRGTAGYFLRKFASVTGLNALDPVFGPIAAHLNLEFEPVADAKEAHLVYGRRISHPTKRSRQEMTDAVGFFWALGLAMGVKHADLVIDNEALNDESGRKRAVEDIATLTGIEISLEKYKYKDGRHRAVMSKEVQPMVLHALKRQAIPCSAWLRVSTRARPYFE